jgi:tRNA1(Val) A37 N6-methylase TrmN6
LTLVRPDHTTFDTFLGGRLRILQPRAGFRAGIDAVLLAAAVPARSGQTCLELGCGVGTASLCLSVRVAGLAVAGLELQPDYADLARQNAAANGAPLEVVTGNVARPPQALLARSFDHVFANPPYFSAGSRGLATDAGRETARGEGLPLTLWIDTAVRRLRPGGTLTLIQRPDRLPDLLRGCDSRVGAIEVLPVAPRRNKAAGLLILRAVKGRRTPLVLLPALVMHDGDAHLEDADSYTESIANVLKEGAPLPWPGPPEPARKSSAPK